MENTPRLARSFQLLIAMPLMLMAASLAGPAAGPMPAAREEAVVLTPKPGPEPRIHGARVFGVRPGSPFLFTIPATGDRPMTFGVENLPEGLVLDTATGQIT